MAKVSLSIDEALLKRVDALAETLGTSRSACMCDLMRDALDEAEAQAKVIGDPVVMGAYLQAMQQPGVVAALARAMGEQIDEKKTQQVLEFFKAGEAAMVKPPRRKPQRGRPLGSRSKKKGKR